MANEGLTQIRNLWESPLTADVSSSATTLPVVTTSGMPTAGIVWMGREAVYYTGLTGTSFTGCTRGFDGTTATVHGKGGRVQARFAAAHHNDMAAAVAAAATAPRQLGSVSGNGSSSVLEIASIPATYRTLECILTGRSDNASANTAVRLTFETSPTAGAYDGQRCNVFATTVSADENIGSTDYITLAAIAAATGTANVAGAFRVVIPDYSNTTFFKTIACQSVGAYQLASGGLSAGGQTGIWESTAAIDRVRFTLAAGNWVTGSRLTVYGWPG